MPDFPMSLQFLKPILSLVIAYLLGSIPTSYLIGKIFFKTDIRKSGSGNTGATNALRTFGTKVGIIVLVIDMLKGVAAVVTARELMSGCVLEQFIMIDTIRTLQYNLIVSLSGLVAILGHVFSLWLGFKGGKGVATAAGVFLALMAETVLICLILFIFIVAITKYVSLGSILAASALLIIEIISQLYMTSFVNIPRLVLVALVVVLIIIRHKANIRRLLDGTENKISFNKKTKEQ
jgi:glycerol-3-phosphate acyltransferase PlsY